jgi:hypothetical protein
MAILSITSRNSKEIILHPQDLEVALASLEAVLDGVAMDGTDINPYSYIQVRPSRSLRQRTVSSPGNIGMDVSDNSNFVRTNLGPPFSPVRPFNALLLDE